MNYYDPKKLSKFITYLAINNLYGWAMREYLPYDWFKWLKYLDVMSVSEKNPIGNFLEVDLKCPYELHELHNYCLLPPEKVAVSSDMLSNYCKIIADKYEIKVGDVKKLIPNMGNKTNYVLHYRNVQLYLSLGMKQSE